MELILKCNYYEATIGGNGTLFYYIKERLTLLAKYYPATNEYSCVVMGKENGFGIPERIYFHDAILSPSLKCHKNDG